MQEFEVFALPIGCIKAILGSLFIDFRLTFCYWVTSYILFLNSVIFEKIFYWLHHYGRIL